MNVRGSNSPGQGHAPAPAPTEQSLHKETSAKFRESHKQRRTLVYIARTPYLQQYLVKYCDMPMTLVQNCIYWADVQAYFSEPDNADLSITAKHACIQDLLLFVKSLRKWHQHRDCLLSKLEMPVVPEPEAPKGQRSYSAFRPCAARLSPAPDALHEHPMALVNEDVGTCINFIVESATFKPKTPGGGRKLTNSSTWSVSRSCKDAAIGPLDRGIPRVKYSNDYDTDDSSDSANNYDEVDTDDGDNDGEDGHDDSNGETSFAATAATAPVGGALAQNW